MFITRIFYNVIVDLDLYCIDNVGIKNFNSEDNMMGDKLKYSVLGFKVEWK